MLDADALRARFATALSDAYRAEVPSYGVLLGLVARINAAVAPDADEGARVVVERHGAIRVGRADELAQLARLFGVLGLQPVGYYDLAPAGIPVHATAFRPVTDAALARQPFRMFTSLLRLELIADPALRAEASRILARRQLFGPALLALIDRAEGDCGLGEADAARFIAASVDLFRWHREAVVDADTYARLHAAHPLLADVVSFRGPHVNHLTPRVLDIDAAHRGMASAGLAPKDTIEGPPPRAVPVLLRQTSFRAVREPILFPGADGEGREGAHAARFGEIESRGAALTRRGRALYDRLLAAGALDRMPDDWATLRREGLVHARYRRRGPRADDAVEEVPITYEDFLPVSAAGIFRSNLGDRPVAEGRDTGRREDLTDALGRSILDEMALYEATEADSLRALAAG